MTMWPSENFLLESKSAVRLYHEFAADLPVIDYHNHLSPALIASNHRFADMTEIWLDGDHYKWRAMRACGVSEEFITGNISHKERFHTWAKTVPKLIGSPLYQWTHMELANTFDFTPLFNADTAEAAWNHGNEQLRTDDFTTQTLLNRAHVKILCTTDDPCDNLSSHKALFDNDSFKVAVLPTFRPDPIFSLEDPGQWNEWIDRLGNSADQTITDWNSLLSVLESRVSCFNAAGCRLADHGLEVPYSTECRQDEAVAIFATIRNGCCLSEEQAIKLNSAVLYELGLLYHQFGWTQQFHIGALRNVNSRIMGTVGRDAGCDTIGDAETARPLARMLDRWDKSERLAKTILYNLNPRDNELMAAMAGSFNDGSSAGKVQYGTAWWFNDQKNGIERQLTALADIGVLSTFVGMVTDSRSFLSFSRHEYFRRILSNLLGSQMDRGEIPDDFCLVGDVVKDICFRNAERFFGF